MNADDQYLVKLVSVGTNPKVIAAKLNITEQEVALRWKRIQKQAETVEFDGYAELCGQFTILANQYQLVGESLKLVASALSRKASNQELLSLIGKTDKETLHNLKTKVIVLKNHTIQNPAESLKNSIASN